VRFAKEDLQLENAYKLYIKLLNKSRIIDIMCKASIQKEIIAFKKVN
jgi:hypothetical protein